MSPKPLVSPSGASSAGSRTGAATSTVGEARLAVVFVLLAVRALFEEFDAGVRFLVEGTGTSSAVGSAPVIIRSASSTVSTAFPAGNLLLVRALVAFVTSPSLSSLKLLIGSLTFFGLPLVGFAVTGCGAGFATRVVANVILVLFGRGIVAVDRLWDDDWYRVADSQASVVVCGNGDGACVTMVDATRRCCHDR